MAPPRADKKKFSKEKSKKKTDKTDSKSSLPSTTIAVAITAFIAISVAIYYKNGFNMEGKLDEAQRTSIRNTARTSNNKKTEINADFKILPRLDGVKSLGRGRTGYEINQIYDVRDAMVKSDEDNETYHDCVGHIQKRQLSPGKMYEIKTLSLKPLIFEIPNFLSDEDCQTVVDLASKEGLDTSEVQDPETGINIEPTNEETFNNWDYNHDGVIDKVEVMHNLVDLSDLYFSEEDIEKMFEELKVDKNTNGVMDLREFLTVRTEKIMRYLHNLAKTLPRVKSRNSRQTWLDHRKIKGLNDRVAALTKLPRAVIEESEELQVVHYDPEGHYHCHHDSEDVDPRIPCCVFRDRRRCRLCRYITVLYFLNDVDEGGETAFPVANNATFSIEAWAQITKYRCDLSKHCHKANLFVKPRKGTAIMWYNHMRDDKTGWHGRLDQMTYHGGCDILKGEKWIANNWINILGDSRETMVSYKNPKKKI